MNFDKHSFERWHIHQKIIQWYENIIWRVCSNIFVAFECFVNGICLAENLDSIEIILIFLTILLLFSLTLNFEIIKKKNNKSAKTLYSRTMQWSPLKRGDPCPHLIFWNLTIFSLFLMTKQKPLKANDWESSAFIYNKFSAYQISHVE